MLNYFYDKTCSTQRVTFTSVSGGTKPVATNIYTDIPCAFWATANKQNLVDQEQAQQVDKKSYTANFQGHNTNVKIGDYLELKDKTGVSMGKFIVMDTIQYPNIKGEIDNVALTIKRYDG